MVEATLNYLAPMAERPYFYTYPPPEGVPGRNNRGGCSVKSITVDSMPTCA